MWATAWPNQTTSYSHITNGNSETSLQKRDQIPFYIQLKPQNP